MCVYHTLIQKYTFTYACIYIYIYIYVYVCVSDLITDTGCTILVALVKNAPRHVCMSHCNMRMYMCMRMYTCMHMYMCMCM